jgi:hypothetical protein
MTWSAGVFQNLPECSSAIPVQIDGMISILDDASVEKQIKCRDGGVGGERQLPDPARRPLIRQCAG